MATYQPKTSGGFDYKILDRIDGSIFGRVFRGQWIAVQWTKDGTASTNSDDNLIRTDSDRTTTDVYWVEDSEGRRRTTTLRPAPGDPFVILASKQVNLREGVIEV